ncbi:hypothetical protein CO661_09850 [Sinorhizobium fredii]|uniref:Uncharacterized protein n=1 Tax=Rhizobium fredii TaxID=380 RepID=A0A2A6M067_RHIFR|nr:hypothetical protein [Sinorhizobium fredii]PDT48164.1 hypothetical protein CO661_09850 [Sinorhizobium fredii]
MTELAEFDFSLEFSTGFATKVLQACFASGATPGRFSYDQTNQPGLIGTRSVPGGAALYQFYLLEIEAGYDLALRTPAVDFDAHNQRVIIKFHADIKIPRNIVGRIFDIAAVDTALASDPSLVDVAQDYPEEFRSGPRSDPYPGRAAPPTGGTITIQFSPAAALFGAGKRLFAQTAGVTMSNVLDVQVLPVVGTEPTLRELVAKFAAKALTYLISTEANGYDLTPMIGNLDALGITVKEPITMRIGVAPSGPVIAYAANILPLNNTGIPSQLRYLLDGSDFCVSFSEAMFSEIVSYLYIDDPDFPIEFDLDGLPEPGGPVSLAQPRLRFLNSVLEISFAVHDAARRTQTISALIECNSVPHGPMQVSIRDLQSNGSILNTPGPRNLTSVIAFHILGAAAGSVPNKSVLSSLLQTSTHSSLDAGLSEFLRTGALAFGFRTPIRGTGLFIEATPVAIRFRPGICTFFNSAVITS